MNRIIFEVDDDAAENWRHASIEKKSQLSNTVNSILTKAFDKNDEDFWQFLDRVGKKAQENGITEEELEKLLNE